MKKTKLLLLVVKIKRLFLKPYTYVLWAKQINEFKKYINDAYNDNNHFLMETKNLVEKGLPCPKWLLKTNTIFLAEWDRWKEFFFMLQHVDKKPTPQEMSKIYYDYIYNNNIDVSDTTQEKRLRQILKYFKIDPFTFIPDSPKNPKKRRLFCLWKYMCLRATNNMLLTMAKQCEKIEFGPSIYLMNSKYSPNVELIHYLEERGVNFEREFVKYRTKNDEAFKNVWGMSKMSNILYEISILNEGFYKTIKKSREIKKYKGLKEELNNVVGNITFKEKVKRKF